MASSSTHLISYGLCRTTGDRLFNQHRAAGLQEISVRIVSPSGLAGAADVAPEVISTLEEGREVSPGHEEAIRSALEAEGIGFPFESANGCVRPAGVTYSPRDRKEGH